MKKGSRARRTQARVVEPFVMTMALLLMAKGAAAEPPNKPAQDQSAPKPRTTDASAAPQAPKAEKKKPGTSDEHPADEADAPAAGEPPANGSPSAESDEKASSAEQPSDDDAESSSPNTAAAKGAEEGGLPVGYATDKYGAPLVAVHLGGEPGTRYLVGPPRAQGDSFGNKGLPRLDMDELDTLCTSPCARWLYPGSYSLALARDGNVVRVPDVVTISAPVEVVGDYESRTLWRAIGWGVMGAGIAGGTLFILSSLDNCDSTDGTCLQGQGSVFLGVGTMLAGLTVGLLLTQMDDRATAEVKPAPPALGEPK